MSLPCQPSFLDFFSFAGNKSQCTKNGNQNRSKIGEVNSLQVTLRVDRPAPISSEIV